MNEQLLSAGYVQYCQSLLAIRQSGDWRATHDSFNDYVQDRWSLSKSRAKLLCDFAKFYDWCLATNMQLPDAPENVKPVLGLPQKKWLEAWELVTSCAPDMRAIDASHCQAVMDRFGLIARKRIPQNVLNGQKARRAAKTLAELEDGEQLVDQIGPNGLGKHWDDAVRVAIDADQARMNGQKR